MSRSRSRSRSSTGKRRQIERDRRRRRELRRDAFILAAVIVVAIIGIVAFAITRGNPSQPGASALFPPQPVPFRPVDGIPCQAETVKYHEHAHLTILRAGRQVSVPEGIGINRTHVCLYWLHTHDSFGIIHIESPHRVVPTLGALFDIWRQPLSRSRLGTASTRTGLRVYVDQRLYTGNPRSIPLRPHADITIELGPPFRVPAKYVFPSGY